MKHNYIAILLLLPLVISITSCKKLVEIAPPKNQLVTSEVFKDSVNASSAVVGIYTNIMKGLTSLTFGNGAITVYTAFSSDEMYPTSNIASENEFFNNSISPINNTLNSISLWKNAYQLIYQTNACIEGVRDSKALSVNLKNQLLGEAKFARALFYFYLVNLYGDVPLITSTDYSANSVTPRSSSPRVYEQIEADLTEAVSLLPLAYVASNRIRPNRYAAMALLSSLYLYEGKWDNADKTATTIITSGVYTLEPNPGDVFLPASHETIWQMTPLQPGFETAEGYKFIPGTAATLPKCVLSDNLLNSFDSLDKRRQLWTKFNTVNGQKYYYPYKYHLGNDGNTSPKEYYVVLRLAEQYLIRAEARAHLNNLQGTTDDINTIRVRAGLKPSAALDQSSLLAAVQDERRFELFCEWGHRWFDLKRLGIADKTLRGLKPNWQPTSALYPIPFSEIQTNPFLRQNPGY